MENHFEVAPTAYFSAWLSDWINKHARQGINISKCRPSSGFCLGEGAALHRSRWRSFITRVRGNDREYTDCTTASNYYLMKFFINRQTQINCSYLPSTRLNLRNGIVGISQIVIVACQRGFTKNYCNDLSVEPYLSGHFEC